MQESTTKPQVDEALLRMFRTEIKSKVPHAVERNGSRAFINPTPLEDLTTPLIECARIEYGLDVPAKSIKVFGKFDSKIAGGSVKVRPAVEIIEDAIASGKLRTGQTVFEATSGNFGIALGMLEGIGINVIFLVSRKLQRGVLDELNKNSAKAVNLDIDICPAPGLALDQNLAIAKATASNVREQLADLGLDAAQFDKSRAEIEALLARQDVINLAKMLAKIYGGFCPEQYDNELNVKSHEAVTAPEIDQQLKDRGLSLADFKMVSAFGTGGTSAGISKYIQKKYGKRSVHVVFPLNNQDVAGIRTKDKALGLRFYDPTLYAGQHEVDFEQARRVLRFCVGRGYDIGESSALALYACLQMLNYGVGEKFVVMLADGIDKYRSTLGTVAQAPPPLEVTLPQASSSVADYGEVLWTHGMFVPKEDGIKLVASSLGCDESKIKVARASDVQSLISTEKIPDNIRNVLPKDNRKVLLVCMAGATSLRVAQILAANGMQGQSLTGGIMSLSENSKKQPSDLVQMSRE
ncbi:MAG TPA: pyridoxal-phosphate dependent enzyme [Candidatus Bathyarchaeia archaeon]|nr:pyridoxal-phosphate dependent enzyme [Candidatus Bathyarchaeia archaeon]